MLRLRVCGWNVEKIWAVDDIFANIHNLTHQHRSTVLTFSSIIVICSVFPFVWYYGIHTRPSDYCSNSTHTQNCPNYAVIPSVATVCVTVHITMHCLDWCHIHMYAYCVLYEWENERRVTNVNKWHFVLLLYNDCMTWCEYWIMNYVNGGHNCSTLL